MKSDGKLCIKNQGALLFFNNTIMIINKFLRNDIKHYNYSKAKLTENKLLGHK